MCGKRKTQTANDNDLISVSLKSFAPLPLEGADERSEAGLVSPNVGVPFHAANLRPFFSLLPKEGGRKRGCVYRHRSICGEGGAFSAISATPEPAPTISFPEESGEVRGTCEESVSP